MPQLRKLCLQHVDLAELHFLDCHATQVRELELHLDHVQSKLSTLSFPQLQHLALYCRRSDSFLCLEQLESFLDTTVERLHKDFHIIAPRITSLCLVSATLDDLQKLHTLSRLTSFQLYHAAEVKDKNIIEPLVQHLPRLRHLGGPFSRQFRAIHQYATREREQERRGQQGAQ